MGWFIFNHIFSIILSSINITRLFNQEKDLEILILVSGCTEKTDVIWITQQACQLI
jgi:hypothetical protein